MELDGAEEDDDEEAATEKSLKEALAFSKVEERVTVRSSMVSFDCDMALRTAFCNPSIPILVPYSQIWFASSLVYIRVLALGFKVAQIVSVIFFFPFSFVLKSLFLLYDLPGGGKKIKKQK